MQSLITVKEHSAHRFGWKKKKKKKNALTPNTVFSFSCWPLHIDVLYDMALLYLRKCQLKLYIE